MRYPVEDFSDAERALLAPHFTNLDRPVFALVNLPETVKGALFARYSRYSGTVRRLYLEEFAEDAQAGSRPFDGAEGERAAGLYERVFLGYGDDSIAQVGGAHVACEWVSNVLTKVLQRGRLAAYLEQSTRYIPYDKPMSVDGGYRYYANEELGPEFGAAMDEVFSIYSASLKRVETWAAERWPRGDDEPEGPWQRSIRAKALDLLRGLLPAATLSHVGIYASGQAYEQMLLRLMASPLPEAREYGGMILNELKQVMPSFVSRVERPDRGGEWIGYLQQRRERPSSGSPASASTGAVAVRRAPRSSSSTSTAAKRACSQPACSSRPRCPRPRCWPASTSSTATSAPSCSRRWWASAATAATAPAAASRRCATASRSSPTTAPSATCSATAC
ncbi:MAG TPA: FAD-dependent thymidylate synthase [Solirubrobacterales bacterium]|nr:FAD-dependent thymidylate synthase [Solirubrobacterales bacterium]